MENDNKRLDEMAHSISSLGSKIAQLQITLKEDVAKVKEELLEDYEKLSKDFFALQKDYEVTRSFTQNTLKKLDKLPDVIQSLRETIITINLNLDVNTKTTEELKTNIGDIKSELRKEQEKGKFDFVSWIRDAILPALIIGGMVYMVLQMTGKM